MAKWIKRVGPGLLLAWLCVTSVNAQEPTWASISGNVQLADGTPICAMVLANGQYMFSCDGAGSYFLDVPLDPSGAITLFSFADGFAPYSINLGPTGFPVTVFMDTAPPDSPLIALTSVTGCAANTWVRITGDIQSFEGDRLCAMVLANGQQMFTCGESLGRYDLTVPANEYGEITVFGFADGFQPYSETFNAPACDALVGTWRTEFGETITFGSDGTFSTDICGGFEAGAYVYDPVAHRFSSIIVTQDDNGECGLANNGAPNLDLLVRREGDTLVVNNGEEILYRVQ